MSLMEPIVAAPDTRWAAVTSQHNADRGAFIQDYARGEALISKTLLAFHNHATVGAEVPLPHLAGQRLAALRKILEAQKADHSHASSALTALDKFQRFERDRHLLCHGTATTLLDQQGRWYVWYKLLAFNANRAEQATLFLTQADAAHLLNELAMATRTLSSALGQVRPRARESKLAPAD